LEGAGELLQSIEDREKKAKIPLFIQLSGSHGGIDEEGGSRENSRRLTSYPPQSRVNGSYHYALKKKGGADNYSSQRKHV